jgi:drug/metabolite transporter (DMT)-like permease
VERAPTVVFGLLCLIWGSTWLAIKIGLEFLPPFLFAGIRFAIASTVLVFLVRLLHAQFPKDRSSWMVMIFLGIFQITLPYGLVFWGEQYISSGLSAVLFATLPFFVLIIAHVLIKDEPLTRRKILGVIAAFVGLAVIFWHDLGSVAWSIMQPSLLGSLAVLGSAASGGLANVVAKKYANKIDPPANVFVQAVIGATCLSLVGMLIERDVPLRWVPSAIVSVAYLGVVGSALAFVGLYWLLTKTSATNSSLIVFITPIVALLLGWVVLREELEPVVALGTMLILSGLYLTIYTHRE